MNEKIDYKFRVNLDKLGEAKIDGPGMLRIIEKTGRPGSWGFAFTSLSQNPKAALFAEQAGAAKFIEDFNEEYGLQLHGLLSVTRMAAKA
jgi:hypothetical protein